MPQMLPPQTLAPYTYGIALYHEMP
jgi:hypothetical protein